MGAGSNLECATSRLLDVTLDERSIGHQTSDVEHERRVAIFDLLQSNYFALADGRPGPYRLHLAIAENRLVLTVADAEARTLATYILSLAPLRRMVKDYFAVCESYHAAIRTAPLSRIEAIDMGRRALHDEASQVLQERLARKIRVDLDTARRLFTLICALHWNG